MHPYTKLVERIIKYDTTLNNRPHTAKVKQAMTTHVTQVLRNWLDEDLPPSIPPTPLLTPTPSTPRPVFLWYYTTHPATPVSRAKLRCCIHLRMDQKYPVFGCVYTHTTSTHTSLDESGVKPRDGEVSQAVFRVGRFGWTVRFEEVDGDEGDGERLEEKGSGRWERSEEVEEGVVVKRVSGRWDWERAEVKWTERIPLEVLLMVPEKVEGGDVNAEYEELVRKRVGN